MPYLQSQVRCAGLNYKLSLPLSIFLPIGTAKIRTESHHCVDLVWIVGQLYETEEEKFEVCCQPGVPQHVGEGVEVPGVELDVNRP